MIPKKIPKKDGVRQRGRARGAFPTDTAPDAALRAHGLRLTGPRRVVLEVVRGTESHPTASAVHRVVRRRLPRASLGTVYRNLRLLVAEGLVKELPGPHARFDGNLAEHHHFTCFGCDRIADVPGPVTGPRLRALYARVAAEGGFAVTHHRVEFYGRCPACRTERGRRGTGSRARERTPPRGVATSARRRRTDAVVVHTQRKRRSTWPGRVSRGPRVTRT